MKKKLAAQVLFQTNCEIFFSQCGTNARSLSISFMPDPLTNLELNAPGGSVSPRVTEFLRTMLGQAPEEHRKDLEFVTQCWQKLTGAKWVWFWMFHPCEQPEHRWEIMALYARNGDHKDYLPKPQTSDLPDVKPVMQLVADINRPVFLDDLEHWRHPGGEKDYGVRRWKELHEMGCRSLLAIPFRFPQLPANNKLTGLYDALSSMRGGLCIHFDGKRPDAPLLSEEEYLLAAQATATAVAASIAEEQRQFLYHLDLLAARYLTKAHQRPAKKRENYLKDVTEVIQKRMRVQGVSFFYATPSRDELECIATTGLENAKGPLAEDQLRTARYSKGASKTWEVYKTGKPFVWHINGKPRPENEKAQWWETPCRAPEEKRSWALFPINVPNEVGGQLQGVTTLGVMRCVDDRDWLVPDRERVFDPVQLQTLSFITDQVAPVLETMAAFIRREREISFIKHDLHAPLRVIEDQALAIEEYVAKRSNKWPERATRNIYAATLLARNMAGALGRQERFRPQHTLLEADIIARVRQGLEAYAWAENRMRINYRDIRLIPSILVDQNLVERALTNLILNGIKYGYKETEVNVIGEARADCYAVRVENFGIGIPEGDEERVFESMFRSANAAKLKSGLGAGLTIALEAMKQNGGDLILERANSPTVFTMIFPKNPVFPSTT
jgi:signal transduction histidine kinase